MLRHLNVKISKDSEAFTLVEILTSITIFTFLIMATLGVYITSLTKHRQALRSQVVDEDLNYATEIMYKDIKDSRLMAYCDSALSTFCDDGKTIYLDHPTKKIVGANCLALAGFNTDCRHCSSGDHFSCLCCLQYRFNSPNNQIEIKGINDLSFLPLTSSRVNIENVNFYIPTMPENSEDQPRVTISIRARESGDTLGTSEVILQMTVTQNDIFNLYAGQIW